MMKELVLFGAIPYGLGITMLVITLATRFDCARLRKVLKELSALREQECFAGNSEYSERCAQAHALFFRYVESQDFLVWWFDRALLKTRATLRTVKRLGRDFEFYQLDETHNYQRSKERLTQRAVTALEALVGDLGEAVRGSAPLGVNDEH